MIEVDRLRQSDKERRLVVKRNDSYEIATLKTWTDEWIVVELEAVRDEPNLFMSEPKFTSFLEKK